MITVVSPRLTLLEVVVMVRVTLQEVRSTESPIDNAASRVRRICLMYFFIVVVFIGSTINNHYHPFFYITKNAQPCRLGYAGRHARVVAEWLF